MRWPGMTVLTERETSGTPTPIAKCAIIVHTTMQLLYGYISRHLIWWKTIFDSLTLHESFSRKKLRQSLSSSRAKRVFPAKVVLTKIPLLRIVFIFSTWARGKTGRASSYLLLHGCICVNARAVFYDWAIQGPLSSFQMSFALSVCVVRCITCLTCLSASAENDKHRDFFQPGSLTSPQSFWLELCIQQQWG